jgi:hypothetical protein
LSAFSTRFTSTWRSKRLVTRQRRQLRRRVERQRNLRRLARIRRFEDARAKRRHVDRLLLQAQTIVVDLRGDQQLVDDLRKLRRLLLDHPQHPQALMLVEPVTPPEQRP